MAMNSEIITASAAARYDHSRKRTRNYRLPPDYPTPRPTAEWPIENVELLERYRTWLLSGGASPHVVAMLYIPMAGNALGLNLKPHPQLDLAADLELGLDYVKAKRLSDEWIDMNRVALEKLRHFMRQERGLVVPDLPPAPDLSRYHQGLPSWIIRELESYQHIRQRNWRSARLNSQILRFWCGQAGLWQWLFSHYDIVSLSDIRRSYIFAYIDHRLAGNHAAQGINQDLRAFHAFLRFLQSRDYEVPQALFRIPGLKEADTLPQFLSDEQVRQLRDDFEQQLRQATTPVRRRDALLNRATFYLLWQGGLRLGEVEELRLQDLDLTGRKLMVRRGKGRRDRSIYLTNTVVRALQAFLAVRGMGPSEHVFLYRNEPLKKDLIRGRLKAAGERVGVKVNPHRLRHTCATQLLNAGCRVTSIQKFLGHQRLNSTMIYARVHDRTVAEDYYTAMEQVEKRLDLCVAIAEQEQASHLPTDRSNLLLYLDQLALPDLAPERRLDLVTQMRRMLSLKAA